MENAGWKNTDSRPPRACPRWLEGAGLAALAGLALFFLATSWRRWPDPLIDFGKELYVPWRISHGAVLYRDVDDFYGPLSQYFNAGLFALFGPGLMVLVTANLCLFTGILAVLYGVFRRAWGVGAALAASSVFIAVFAFSESVRVGNYNYVTPYAHEATHGILVCLVLVAALPGWIERVSPGRGFLVGGLVGLTAVLKPEFMLAAGLLTVAAVVLKRRRQALGAAELGAWVAGAVLPTAAFAAFFATQVPWWTAWQMACRGWLNVATTTRFTADPAQIRFLGFDQPWWNLIQQVRATAWAVALLAAIGGAIWCVGRLRHAGWRGLMLACCTVGAGAAGCWAVDWFGVGRCLMGLVSIYLLACVWSLATVRNPATDAGVLALRLLVALLAVALMGRMILFGRTFHFGFYQAALAALLVPAVLIGEVPSRLRAGTWGRALAAACCVALLAPAVFQLAGHSQEALRRKTHPVGSGRDQFYSLVPEIDPVGDIVAQTTAWLTAEEKPGQTLLVLPEGVMINYLTRLPSPVAPFFFFSSSTRGDREAAIVRDLDRHPPDWVAIVSRDLREFGMQRYGERLDEGGQILRWVGEKYEPAAELGGDPLDFKERGAVILRRKK